MFSDWVVDNAQALAPFEERAISAKCRALQMSTGHQLTVVTVHGLGGHDIADYAMKLGNYWGVGRKGLNDGIVLPIAPHERGGSRGPNIAVGRGLATVLTDAEAKAIIDARMMPQLRTGNIAAALLQGTDAIARELALPERKAA